MSSSLSSAILPSSYSRWNDQCNGKQCEHHFQRRYVSMLPESLQSVSIWGASGMMLKGFNYGGIPYWAGFLCTSVTLRALLSPLVVHAAHVSARFATVSPDVQFLLTLFQNDLKLMRERGAPSAEKRTLVFTTMKTLSGIYKLYKINPFAVFLSPLLQIPCFIYISTDLRKIINGADPQLAQQLTEGGVLWFTDLTEPDPWYGLPILGGLMLYYNVEVAIGKKSLGGEVTSKSNFALYMKDFFQSLAVFMPCFMSQSPAGIQLYLIASFMFTYIQGKALRSDPFRQLFGLPLLQGEDSRPKAKYATEFMQLKKLEKEAIEARGDGEILGKGVLAPGFEASFAGTKRTSTIKGSEFTSLSTMPSVSSLVKKENNAFIHGISAPVQDSSTHLSNVNTQPTSFSSLLQHDSDMAMDRANRGLPPIEFIDLGKKEVPDILNTPRFKKSRKSSKRKK
jgi:membrane protein insertase Oxa1/YidC/SpoIIIJ